MGRLYGEEAGPDYPPRPTPKRRYELEQGIRRFLGARPERVAVAASSSWSHSFLAHKFQCRAIDIEFDRRHLAWIQRGEGHNLAALSPEDIQQSGDHEILNWIIALGILGDRPARIVDVRESHTQLAYRVAAIWDRPFAMSWPLHGSTAKAPGRMCVRSRALPG